MQQTNEPFLLPSSPRPLKDELIKTKLFPKENDNISSKKFGILKLGKSVSSGGEGIIYKILGKDDLVCKIYHPEKLTKLRKDKVELMVSRDINYPGICWAIDIALNANQEFVGYIMPMASGKPMQTSMFIKPVLLKNYPKWDRKILVKIAISFLEKMRFLHSMNIIVGDINPLNVLVEPSGKIWFVDTDSYQIENFACPVGTVNFTAPEIQNKDYANFLRTKEHELFAIATMLFMILLPGKPPYSQQGGESQSDNIKKMNFSYWCDEKANNTPEGPWAMIWANLLKALKNNFCMAFKQNQRITIDVWLKDLQVYLHSLEKGYLTSELFPLTFKIYDPIQAKCGKCSIVTTASKSWVEKMKQQNKDFLCGECIKKIKLQSLAKQSLSAKPSLAQTANSKTIISNSANIRKSQNMQSKVGGISYGRKSNTAKPNNYNYNNSNNNGVSNKNNSSGGGFLTMMILFFVVVFLFKIFSK